MSRYSNRLPLPWTVAWRYMRGHRSRLLSNTARAALAATSLGVTAMVVTMALMSGYTRDLARKLVGIQAELVVRPLDLEAFESTAPELVEELGRLQGVARVGLVAYSDGSIASPGAPEGITVQLKGVETSDPALPHPDALVPDSEGLPGVLLGKELAARLGAAAGDKLRLTVLGLHRGRTRFRYRSVRVAGTFSIGFSEVDKGWVIADRRQLQALRGPRGLDFLEIRTLPGTDTDDVESRVREVVGADLLVTNWLRQNRPLFAALRLQQTVLFLVLGLIVVVSTFNVAATLVILVRERMRDIGVLRALGLSGNRLWWIFVGYGLLLGTAGIVLGVVLGVGICWLLTEYELIRFPPEVAAIYFIESVPFRIRLSDLTWIVLFSLTVTFLACAFPARQAAAMNPSRALRYE